MMRFLVNWRVLTGAAIVAAVLALAFWPTIVEVDIVTVNRGDLLATIDEEGTTRVRQRFVISAPVAGRLQRLEVQAGDRVHRGRTVARLLPAAPVLLDSRTQAETAAAAQAAEAQLGQAKAERARATAAWERASSHVKRRRELADAGILARDQFEADVTELKIAEEARRAADFAVERAEQELKMAKARLQPPTVTGGAVTIASPVTGIVLKRYRESETDVPIGEPLLEVGDSSALEIVCDLLSTDAVRIAPGTRVIIEKWGGDEVLEGRVRYVEPSGFLKTSALGVEEQRVNVIIDFEKTTPGNLGDGYRVEVRVVESELKDVLKVPVGSLFRQGDAWAVFVLESGRARARRIELGLKNEFEAEVVTGLDQDEQVLLHPPDIVTDGSRVRKQTSR
jgi:HlyD family secretion protein